MTEATKASMLEIMQKRIDFSKQSVEELKNHRAVLNPEHKLHDTYTKYLQNAQNTLKAEQDLYNSIQNYAEQEMEPYQEELLEEIEEVEADVANEEVLFEECLEDMDNALAEADKELETDVSDLVMKVREEFAGQLREQMETNFHLEKEIVDLRAQLDDFLKEKDITKSDYEEILNRSRDDKTLAKEYLAMKPFDYAHYRMRDMVDTMKDSYADIKDSVKLTKTAYKDAVKTSCKVAKTKVSSTLSPMVTAAGHTALQSLKGIAGVYKSAMQSGREAIENGKKALSKGIQKLKRTKNILLDTVTLGAYSHVKGNSRMASDADKVYWRDVKDDNPIWGLNHPTAIAARLQGYSPIEAAANEIRSIGNDLVNTVCSVKNKAVAAKNMVENTLDSTVITMRNKANDIRVFVLEGIANHCEKSAHRAEIRIKQLHQADHKIFEANNECRKILHNMTAIIPYKKEEYQTSKDVESLEENLENLIQTNVREAAYCIAKSELGKEAEIVEKLKDSKDPACQVAYKMASRRLTRETNKNMQQLKKDIKWAGKALNKLEKVEEKAKTKHEKEEIRKEMAVEAARDKQFAESIDAYNELMDNKDELKKNQEKISELKNRLENKMDKTKDLREKAQKLRSSIPLTPSQDEKDEYTEDL